MILLKLFLKAIKVLNSETAANSLAVAFALGLFVGLTPLFSLQAIAVLLCVLFLRVNLTAWLASLIVGKLLAQLLAGPFDALGGRLLEDESLRGLWTMLSHDSLLSYLRVTDSIALGGTLVGLAGLVPAFLLGRLGVIVYRSKLEGKLANSALGRSLGGLKIVTLYRKLTSPFA